MPAGYEFLKIIGERVIELDNIIVGAGDHFDGVQIVNSSIKKLPSFIKMRTMGHALKDIRSGDMIIVGIHLKDKVLGKVIKRSEEIPTNNFLIKQVGDVLFLISPVHIFYYVGYHYLKYY